MEKHKTLILVGEQIRSLRKAKGFSQEGFASHAGISRGFYGAIERGERNISVRNLIKIAKALKVEVGKLFPPRKSL